jgi:hypothetical protein
LRDVSDPVWFLEESTTRGQTSVTTAVREGRLGPVDHHGGSVRFLPGSGGEVNGEQVEPTTRNLPGVARRPWSP